MKQYFGSCTIWIQMLRPLSGHSLSPVAESGMARAYTTKTMAQTAVAEGAEVAAIGGGKAAVAAAAIAADTMQVAAAAMTCGHHQANTVSPVRLLLQRVVVSGGARTAVAKEMDVTLKLGLLDWIKVVGQCCATFQRFAGNLANSRRSLPLCSQSPRAPALWVASTRRFGRHWGLMHLVTGCCWRRASLHSASQNAMRDHRVRRPLRGTVWTSIGKVKKEGHRLEVVIVFNPSRWPSN